MERVPPRKSRRLEAGATRPHRFCWGLVALTAQHRLKQLIKVPYVPSESCHHGSRATLLSALARLPGLPAKVVVRREHAERGFQVAELLGETQRQPVKSLHEHPLGAVQALYVARTYRPLFPAGYATYASPLRTDHF